MGVTSDASKPVRATGQVTTANFDVTTASFTPPSNTMLVLCVELDASTGEAHTITPSGGGLTWTAQVERLGTETTTGAQSGIYTAPMVTGAALTVTARRVGSTTSSGRVSINCYVGKGDNGLMPVVMSVGANNEGGSTANAFNTTSLTPDGDGRLFVADAEWNFAIAFDASSDLTQDTAGYTGAMSVCDGHKACTNGVGVTGNLDATGAGAAQHKWCQIIVREAAGAAGIPAYRKLSRPFPFRPGASRLR